MTMNDDDDKGSKWQKSTTTTIVANVKVAHVSCIQDFIIIRHISRIATHNDDDDGGEGEKFSLLFSFTQFTSFYIIYG